MTNGLREMADLLEALTAAQRPFRSPASGGGNINGALRTIEIMIP